MNEVEHYFDILAQQVNRAWGHQRSPEGFTEASIKALLACPPKNYLECSALTNSLLVSSVGPQRILSAKFGQPAITVYLCEDFAIDVYFWVDSGPAIHNHPFHGAFTILRGFSLHFLHRFELERHLSDRMLLGSIALENIELLREGDTRGFGGGPTHRLIHIPRGSVSMVIRTVDKPVRYYRYLEPGLGLGIDREREDRFGRKVQLINTLAVTEKIEVLKEYIRSFLQSADLLDTYEFVESSYLKNPYGELTRFSLNVARETHGVILDVLERTMEVQRKLWAVECIRRNVNESDRLLATLATFIESREELLEHTSALTAADDPAGQLAEMFVRSFAQAKGTIYHSRSDVVSMVRKLLTSAGPLSYGCPEFDCGPFGPDMAILQFPLFEKFLH